ncbi:MAG TPA: LacI family DNA-binding transcriptional regulator [Roseiflexaceae bacterium]|nr:LacI family DNA-binding transcriptional regulator [Roseiflexaceae bacterium]
MTTHDHAQPRERVTITDVAATLGVAVSTVSNAYNHPDQLSAQLRERILATAAELGYPGPDPVARGLRRQRAGAVGLLFAERLSYAFNDQATVQLIEGIASALEPTGLGLLLVPGRTDEPITVQQAMVDGFIVYSMVEDNPLLAAVLRRRLPTVLLDQPPRAGIPVITVDDLDGARQTAAHLLALGHRRFGIITDWLGDARSRPQTDGPWSLHEPAEDTFFFTRRRLQGYRAALEAAGVVWEEVPIVERPENSEAEGAAAMRILMALPTRPTAILCITDRLAVGALEAARAADLAVPGDVSIAGFDDIPRTAQTEPPLTTVRQAHRTKGLLAGQALVGLLRGEAVAEHTDLPVQLVVRGSTGPAPRQHSSLRSSPMG